MTDAVLLPVAGDRPGRSRRGVQRRSDPAGQRAATSIGALATPDAPDFDGVCQQATAVPANTVDEAVDTAAAFATK